MILKIFITSLVKTAAHILCAKIKKEKNDEPHGTSAMVREETKEAERDWLRH